MTSNQIYLLLAVGVVLVLASIVLRVYTAGKYEIKPTDLVFVVVPLLVAGIATGRLTGLDMFGVRADLSALWAEAAETKIEGQISSAPDSSVGDVMEMLNAASKGGVGEIPRLIANKTNALTFSLGMGGYYGDAITQYFDALYGSSYLRYIVVNNPDGSLFGLYPAADLIAYFRAAGPGAYDDLERYLNRGDTAAQEWLAQLPGFVPAKAALTANVSKRDALQAMADLNADSLPVVDTDQRFVGTVERSKLTTSLVLAVTDRVAEGGVD
jgi:CBS domain-containing protein